MSRRIYGVLTLVVVLLISVACGTQEGDMGGGDGEAALSISGSVSNEKSWTMSDLEAMDTVEVDYTDKDGNTSPYTGVPVSALLEDAGVASDAAKVTFVASDDYSADVELAEVQACGNCIVAFEEDGSLRVVMPDFSGKLQVKNLVEIQVS